MLNLPKQGNIDITLPRDKADELEHITKEMVTGTELYGFRWQRHLQRLAMTSALMRGVDTVADEDIEIVNHLKKYMNKDCIEKI